MTPDLSRKEFALADARSAADRLEDLRNCHETISRKERLLMEAANRNDLESMRVLNEEIRGLSEIATECVRRILDSTRPPEA